MEAAGLSLKNFHVAGWSVDIEMLRKLAGRSSVELLTVYVVPS